MRHSCDYSSSLSCLRDRLFVNGSNGIVAAVFLPPIILHRHHYNELPADLRARLHLDLPVGFMAYFESRYPCLLMRCVEIACRFVSAEKAFAPFCRVIAPLFQQIRSPTIAVVGAPIAASAAALVVAAPTAPVGDQSVKSTVDQKTLLPLSDVGVTLAAVVTSTTLSSANVELPSSRSAASTSFTATSVVSAQETLTFSLPDAIASPTEQPGDSHYNANTDEMEPIQPPQQVTVSEDVVVWQGSALAQSLGCRGWWRLNLSNPNDHWLDAGSSTAISMKPRTQHQHLVRASTDFKYRSRLCTHWEMTGGSGCPMRKKGKCDFGESQMLSSMMKRLSAALL